MTRPKKWFLEEDANNSVVIKNTDGLIKKPNKKKLKYLTTNGKTVNNCKLFRNKEKVKLVGKNFILPNKMTIETGN